MNWTVQLASSAEKSLRRAPAADSARLRRALEQMADDPFAGDIVRLRGHRFGWRRRVGDYRILYDLDPVKRVVAIGLIARRTTFTYRKR